jgi:predicted metal-dependent enzyme (double-stranded beta helix superfamily)
MKCQVSETTKEAITMTKAQTWPRVGWPAKRGDDSCSCLIEVPDFDLPRELSLQGATPLLARLVREPAFLNSRILPLLEEAGWKEDWYVAHRYDGRGSSYSLQIFVWPPGSRTRIHDHSSWGAFCCAIGCLLEERYERLDDGLQLNQARLKKAWQRIWRQEDGISTVLPYEGGIHRIGNPNDLPAISIHFYGPRKEELDGRDYAPSQDYVCDRIEI